MNENSFPITVLHCEKMIMTVIYRFDSGVVDGSGLLSWPQTGGITILTPEQAALH